MFSGCCRGPSPPDVFIHDIIMGIIFVGIISSIKVIFSLDFIVLVIGGAIFGNFLYIYIFYNSIRGLIGPVVSH